MLRLVFPMHWFSAAYSALGKPDINAFTSVIQRRFAIRVDGVPSRKQGPTCMRPRVAAVTVAIYAAYMYIYRYMPKSSGIYAWQLQ